MILRRAFVIVGLLAGASSAYCDEASKLAKAGELLRLAKMDDTLRQVLGAVAEQTKSGFMQGTTGAKLPPEMDKEVAALRDKVTAIVSDALAWDKLEPAYARIYADAYTESELDAIIVFYKSDAGQAMVANTPVLLTKASALVQGRMKEVQPEIQKAMTEFTLRVKAAAGGAASDEKKK